MKLHILSDLHTEFDDFDPPETGADVVVLAGDIGVGLMAWINIIGILIIFFMGRPALKALKDYEEQKDRGVKNYTFDPKALGIKNATFWEDRKEENNS